MFSRRATMQAGRPGAAGDDRAGGLYWDRLWADYPLPPAMNPRGRSLDDYPARKFHRYFERVLAGHPSHGKKLLEVGCAQSVLLPYFARYFGFEVHGLDRSKSGCEKARKILEREQVNGRIYEADFFLPPQGLLEGFDVVISMGVVEHFENTAGCVRALARLLKPEGRIITVIPNLAGVLGALQKVLDRAVYEIHVPLDLPWLARAHAAAGLKVERCEYFLFGNLGVLNLEGWPKGMAYRTAVRLSSWVSKSLWLAEDLLPFIRPNRWTSPYINCMATKLCV